jgi:hypothetical protein
MRKIVVWGVSLVVAIAMFGLMASSAGAISRNSYEWCYADHACFGIVTINRPAWSYRIGGNVEIRGTVSHSSKVWHFDFTNADSEACEVRMSKHGRNYTGKEYCGGTEVETAVWKRL